MIFHLKIYHFIIPIPNFLFSNLKFITNTIGSINQRIIYQFFHKIILSQKFIDIQIRG